MPRTIHTLSDLVRDSEIEATISNGCTTQFAYTAGRSSRRLRVEERWVRERCLGRGAYGTVYKERCDGGAQPRVRAVKEINKNVVAGEEIDHTRELEAIAKFSHPRYSDCFVRSDGWFECGDAVFITMEYFPYGDLQRYLTRPLPEREANEIISQVLEGLKHMHDNRFVHRDLKPGNIMVVDKGPDWWVKIADFGISKRRHEQVTSLQTLQRGTFGFVAPEAIGVSGENLRGSLAAALDMWSLGAVAFQVMTNTGAFPNLFELVEYCSGKKWFPTARLQEHGVSRDGQDFVASLMRLKPEDRLLADEARQHPWIRAGINTEPAAMSGAVGFPRTSEPSPTWSFSDSAERTTRPFDIPPRPASAYRSPYVEDCSDDSDEEKQETAPDGVIMTPANSIRTAPETPDKRTQNPYAGGPPEMNQAAARTAIDEAASRAGQEWRGYPLVIVQTEDDRPPTGTRNDRPRPGIDRPPRGNDGPPAGTRNDRPQPGNDRPPRGNDRPPRGNDRPLPGNDRPLPGDDRPPPPANDGPQPGPERPQRRRQRTKSVHFNPEMVDDDERAKIVRFMTETRHDVGRGSRDDDDFDSMSIDGQDEAVDDSEEEGKVDEYKAGRRPRNGGRRDSDVSGVPAWDSAYRRYTKQLRRASDYILKTRRGEGIVPAWREALEQSLDDL